MQTNSEGHVACNIGTAASGWKCRTVLSIPGSSNGDGGDGSAEGADELDDGAEEGEDDDEENPEEDLESERK